MLDRMAAQGPGMVEYFSRPPSRRSVKACLRKRLAYDHERALEARRRGLVAPGEPRMWILSAGRPRVALRAYGAGVMGGWPAGFWQAGAGARMCFVVLRELPETAETLLLRLLGRGRILQRALDELAALPAGHLLRARALPVMVAFRSPVLHDVERDSDMNALQQAQALYEEWEKSVTENARREGLERGLEQGLEQGQREMLLRLLARRFGTPPEGVTARVAAAGRAELEGLAERVLTARSLDDVFA